MKMNTTCEVCQSFNIPEKFFPESCIFEDAYWRIQHAYSTDFLGWFVFDLKRHIESMHELSDAEYSSFSVALRRFTIALHKVLNTEKEYVATFSEGEGFRHLHIHVVARTKEFDMQFKGPKSFELIKNDDITAVLAARPGIIKICGEIREIF